MIDAKAVICQGAKIAENVEIGPYSVIGEKVEIGPGCKIASHVVIEGNTKIGQHNRFFQFAAIGAIPQDKKYQGEDTRLEIGDCNIFREFCTVHTGTIQGGGLTKIGNHNLIMNYAHIAHDCVLGNGVVMSNNTSLAGHVVVDDFTVFGGFAKVVQFARLGAYSFVVANSDISKDVLPYVMAGGIATDNKLYGLNLIGLKRHGFSEESLRVLKQAYNIILRRGVSTEQALL